MEPVQCSHCGARSSDQGPFCVSCGARLTQPRSEPAMFVPPPEQPARRRSGRSGWKVALGGLVVGLVIIGILSTVLAETGVFNLMAGSTLPNTKGPGWWKATAPGLGTFEFHLAQDQATITEFVFQIPQITCPAITYSVSDVEVKNDPPWTMAQGQFNADVMLEDGAADGGPSIDVALTGAIASTGQQAFGTWVFDGESAPCQGSWTGHPAP